MKKLASLVALIVVLTAFQTQTKAGGCGYVTYNTPQVVEVDRVVPIAYPVPFTVAVPVVSYIQNGASYAPTYSAQLIPQAPVVQSAPKALVQPQTGLTDAQIDAIIDRIETRLKAKALIPENPKASPPPPIPQKSVWDIFKEPRGTNKQVSCASCHTAPNNKGKLVLFNSDGSANLRLTPEQKATITKRVDEGTMPPGADKDDQLIVSDADSDIVAAWANK